MPKKITPSEKLKERMDKASANLAAVMKSKTPRKGIISTYTRIASRLDITISTIINYKRGFGSNGYMIDALIQEFSKLPDIK